MEKINFSQTDPVTYFYSSEMIPSDSEVNRGDRRNAPLNLNSASIKEAATGNRPKELPGHIRMRDDLGNFNNQYGQYFQGITEKLGLDENKMRALISHESRFQSSAKNVLGSKGYMQLTSAPIRDIQMRPQLFAELFQKIDPSLLPSDAPKELKELLAIFREGPSAYKRIQQQIPGLLAKKSQPHVNLLIGSVYAAMLEKQVDSKGTPEKVNPFVESRLQKLSQGAFLSMVARRVRDVIPEVETQQVKDALKEVKSTFDGKKDYLQYRDYNGNTAKYSGGIEHRDIYAAVVLVIDALSKKPGFESYKSRIK